MLLGLFQALVSTPPTTTPGSCDAAWSGPQVKKNHSFCFVFLFLGGLVGARSVSAQGLLLALYSGTAQVGLGEHMESH